MGRSPGRIYRAVAYCLSGMGILLLSGCSRAPSFNILGSFFPAWILCGILGIILAALMRLVFARLRIEDEIKPLVVVYPSLAAFFTFVIWLVFFS